MINKLNLAWDTFDFYTEEISGYEAEHLNNSKTLDNFLNNGNFPQKDQRKRFFKKSNKCIDILLTLYKKQMDSISDLIELNESYEDIPPEKEIDTMSLVALKNITATLIEEMRMHQSEIKDLLG
jgi:hypothetical protein